MNARLSTVVLKPGREKAVRNRHPWIFSGAVQRLEEENTDSDLVRVVNSRGEYLATGTLNRRSQIAVRLLTWDAAEEVDTAFWRRRLERAIAGRAALVADATTDAFRLVHAEADGLPGLIVDCYGPWLAVQCLTLGMARRRDEIAALLAELLAPAGIYARDDAEVRLKEGLALETGPVWGEEPPDRVEIAEHGHRFLVDVKRGHKTGFYLDQRENRRRAAAYCAGRDVLNAFAYTGGFGVYAARAGARSVVGGDVFLVLRRYRNGGPPGGAFDLVILDPPKFASSQAKVMDAARGYKDVNLLAMQLLRPGGMLVTFSCSGLVSADLFQKIVFGASVDARRDVQIVERLAQGPDHPVLLTFPESAYLKGLICRVW
jgi:23S rRNA (cytosine1962-C5)-methyltransferase